MSLSNGLFTPLSSKTEMVLQDSNNSFPLFLRFEMVPSIISLLMFFAIVVCVEHYFLQNRYSCYLPTISEISLGSPNDSVFAISMSFASIVLEFLLTLYISALDSMGILGTKLIPFYRGLGILCPLLLMIMSGIDSGDYPLVNHIISFLFFGCTSIFFIMLMIGTRKLDKGQVLSARIAGTSALSLGFLVIIVWSCIRTSVAVTVIAIGEYLFFIGVILFVISLVGELNKVKLELVLLDDDL